MQADQQPYSFESMKKNSSAIDWLLEEDQPSIRYLALTELLGRSEADSEVKSARENITKVGWARDTLERQTRSESWVNKSRLWQPKYSSAFWTLLILSDLGLRKEEPRIDRACKVWMELYGTNDGGFSAFSRKEGHLCITGNMARAW
jgi:hypothetical protein